MENVKGAIEVVLRDAVGDLAVEMEVSIDHTANLENGDYTSNIALVGAKKLGQNPMDLAEKIKKSLELRAKRLEFIEKVEVAKPGFINFWLSQDYLVSQLGQLLNLDEKHIPTAKTKFSGKNVLVEFAHPNTHKEFHIGHLRNIALGESICRLLEASGAVVRRVNYQGDVGLHVAKALFGLKTLPSKIEKAGVLSIGEKAKLLGEAYTLGSKLYKEDEDAQKEIIALNKQIYAHDVRIKPLWEQTRAWSLEYFDLIYKRLGTSFDRLYFEAEVHESGKAIVLAHITDGIFTKDGGAVIFDGEKYSLHKRVFVTQEGNPTYEGKEMGLGPLQYKEFPFDLAIHVVGPEQAGYFAVTFKALELIDPRFSGKEKHLAYGFVQLKEGKMSSRMGNVLAAEWLLDETKRILQIQFPKMSDNQLEQVAVGAVKYSMLKVGLTQNIHFSFKESISLEGNSGPYIQYTYARTQSVLSRGQRAKGKEQKNSTLYALRSTLEVEELGLLRALHRFTEVIEQAASHFAPNLVCNYLFELSAGFNLFYQKHTILKASNEEFRLILTAGVGQVLKMGLYLLGIEAPKRM